MIYLPQEWTEIKIKLKNKFRILLDSDLACKEGDYDQMLGKLQIILGKTREEMLHTIQTLT